MTEQLHQTERSPWAEPTEAEQEERRKQLEERLGVDPNETDPDKMKFYPTLHEEELSQALPRVWVKRSDGAVEAWNNTGEVDGNGRIILQSPETVIGEDGKEKVLEKAVAPEVLSQEAQSQLEQQYKAIEQEQRKQAQDEARAAVEKAYQEAEAKGEHTGYYKPGELRAMMENVQ